MAMLYLTKDDSLPYDKPKVFFTCHPHDQEAYLRPVCKELFRFCNCAVYYEDPATPTLRDEEYFARLKEMHLMVIPVTAAFLRNPNPALGQDFRFAMEHHIPVLPLVQEADLDKLFAQKCGNLQYLDKTLRSPAAIPYEEKLQQFLDAVLLGNEQIDRIRSHFDGHIFLSYRKKDRRHIRAMMRLIHQFPQFRDIGLWYDEYLTPGEDFNDEIKTHLNKSQLFALIVTPNLVNEENYVKQHEYPMAKEQHKPILPVQFEPTDADALRSGYPQIPNCLDTEDNDALKSALEHSLAGLIKRHNDCDPDHLYHIGLAYLTGTDVEVDQDLAIKLIIQAAEAGLTEAMEKLVKMYHFGQSVVPDEVKAVFWAQKLIETTRRQYQECKDPHVAKLYHKSLFSVTLLFNAGWGQNHAITFAKELVSLSKELCRAGTFSPSVLAAAYEVSASVYNIQGLTSKAADYLLAAFNIRCSLYKDPQYTSLRRLRKVIESCHRLADIYKDLQDLPSAEHYYKLAIQYIGKLPKNAETLPHRTLLAELHQSMGDIFQTQEHYDEALKEYLSALEIAKSVAADSGNDRILISHYHSLAELEDRRSPLLSGRKYWKEALKIAQQLDSNRSTDQTQRDLASCHLHLGASYYSAQGIRIRSVIRAKSLPHLEKALGIYRALDQKHNDVSSKLSIQTALAALTELHFSLGFYHEAEQYCLESLAISQENAKSLNTPNDKLSVTYDCGSLSKIYEAMKQPEKAELYAWRRSRLLEQLAEEVDTCEIWNELAEASFDLAILIQSTQKMLYAIEIWHALAQKHPDIPIYAQREQEAREYLP